MKYKSNGKTAVVQLYRRTLKPVGLIHQLAYRTTDLLLRLYSAGGGFYTMPDDPMSFRLQLLTREFERGTVALAIKNATRGMTVLDIGAHVGYYTRLFSNLVGNDGKVIAFEPNPRTFKALSHNVQKLGNVTTVQAAVSATEGIGELHDSYIDTGSASLRFDPEKNTVIRKNLETRELAPRLRKRTDSRRYTVKTVSLDEWLASAGLGVIDYIKMDIEGAELLALCGMRRTLASSPDVKLTIEFNPRALRMFGVSPRDLLDILQHHGFRIYLIKDGGELKVISDVADMRHLAGEVASPSGRSVNLFCERVGLR